ncbi:2Fe-2S iron-sulfur cluster binding domain-containing protein [Corynebacterium poyangense]|uniref:2Fe-2S iron-sulfur cluster binding domain-containing protein n=1 Tax=Corynebacterium poyangense TaxID=2684405 RepID=A0A7H0SMK5_9CORY|nr:ferredoxin reductase [Corynebacterium poyangense]MBZ8176886.1 2Fe-2S iron-sulfur cluster binding domain-containing protein [Corynebacterium poyangense]QNQ89780.1 2Fe-2S iron-sulfur cluster binding domain-containing protein [Corynebacterium poyangense]
MSAKTRDGLAHVRGVLRRFTSPLLPDDYTQLLNPLWSKRELRGQIISVDRGHADTVHLVIKPGWGVPVDFHAGQYIGIGVPVNGRFVWRSYSLTSSPETAKGLFAITVRAVERGKLSNHLVNSVRPGQAIRLAAPAGDFHLSDPLPAKIAFITAGSGVTPVVSMLRTIKDRGLHSDVVIVHSAHSAEDVLFEDVLHDWGATIHITGEQGRLSPESIHDLIPDLTERVIYACGPEQMLVDLENWAKAEGVEIRTEHFTLNRESDAEGGEITFLKGGAEECGSIKVDGATTLLEAGESAGVQMPFGCRMGICQTCVRQVHEGTVRNLRTGEHHGAGERIRTCVCVAAGDVSIDV